MSTSVAKEDHLMNRLANIANISTEGKEWLKICLDPFHDTPTHCVGMPTGNSAGSVVEEVPVSATITAPGSVLWDALVVLWPWTSNIDLGASGGTISYQTVNEAPSGVYLVAGQNPTFVPGGCTIQGQTAGSNFSPGTAILAQLQPPEQYLTSTSRVIGMGFEVYNVTPELYKGGSVTAFAQPVPTYHGAESSVSYIDNVQSSGNTIVSYPTVVPVPYPPVNTAEALLLPGSKEWPASEGIYSVPTLSTTSVPATLGSYVQPLIFNSSTTVGQPTSALLPKMVDFSSSTVGGPRRMPWTCFNMNGAYFTGLDPHTALRVDVKWYIEIFPDTTLPLLATLAQMSPELDTQALQAYTHAIRDMPVGVMVKENGLGDWFRDAISTVGDYVAPVLSMIPHPAAQALGKGLAIADRLANSNKFEPSQNGQSLRDALQPARESLDNSLGHRRRQPRRRQREIVVERIPPPLPSRPPSKLQVMVAQGAKHGKKGGRAVAKAERAIINRIDEKEREYDMLD